MTSLEFIEQHIEETQTSIKAFELDYELFHREGDKRDAEKLKQILKHLQQIKAKLETLYILHDKLEFSVIEINTEEGIKYHLVMKGYNSLISKEEVEYLKNL